MMNQSISFALFALNRFYRLICSVVIALYFIFIFFYHCIIVYVYVCCTLSTIFSERTTLRSLYAMSRPSVVCLSVVCLLSVCLSVCLSVTLVHPTQAVERFGNFFSPYDSPGTLLFWRQKSLVGDAPFPLKFALKVTHPLSNSEILINIGS